MKFAGMIFAILINKIEVSSDIKGLIFDCDGTLVDSMPLNMQAWREAGMVATDIRPFL